MGVGFVVEGPHFTISARLVERLRLGQGLIRLEPQSGNAPLPRQFLETLQDALPDPHPTTSYGDPHPLDLAEVRMTLEGAAPHRLAIQGGEKKVPVRRRELLRRCGNAARRIEPGLEALG